jgi:hypothetical protein
MRRVGGRRRGGRGLTVIIITAVRLRLFNPASLLRLHLVLLAVRRLLALGFTFPEENKKTLHVNAIKCQTIGTTCCLHAAKRQVNENGS